MDSTKTIPEPIAKHEYTCHCGTPLEIPEELREADTQGERIVLQCGKRGCGWYTMVEDGRPRKRIAPWDQLRFTFTPY
jgi:hypothetical protein